MLAESRSRTRVASKPVGELRPGEVVELEGELVEVLQAPFLGSRGASLLDSFELFWRARVQRVGADERARYATWGKHDHAAVHAAHVAP